VSPASSMMARSVPLRISLCRGTVKDLPSGDSKIMWLPRCRTGRKPTLESALTTSLQERIGSLRGDDNFFYSLASDLTGVMLKKQLDGFFDVGQRFFSCSALTDGAWKLDALHRIPSVFVFFENNVVGLDSHEGPICVSGPYWLTVKLSPRSHSPVSHERSCRLPQLTRI